MLSQYPTFEPLPCQGFDLLHYVLNKSDPILRMGPGPIYIIGLGPMCRMGLAYNRQVCPQSQSPNLNQKHKPIPNLIPLSKSPIPILILFPNPNPQSQNSNIVILISNLKPQTQSLIKSQISIANSNP